MLDHQLTSPCFSSQQKNDFLNLFLIVNHNYQKVLSIMSTKAITKLFSQYVEDFIKSCDSDDKEGILKEMMSKESSKKIEEFVKSNEIRKKRAEKVAKDDKLPKKPKNPYMVFCDRHRSKISEDNKDKSSREITSLMAEKWSEKKLSNDDEFKEIMSICEESKKLHDEQMRQYNIENNIVVSVKETPRDAFYYFKLDQKKNLTGISNMEIHHTLKKQWKKLNEEKNEIVKKYLQIATNNFGTRDEVAVETTEVTVESEVAVETELALETEVVLETEVALEKSEKKRVKKIKKKISLDDQENEA